jgi:hypothetical protein
MTYTIRATLKSTMVFEVEAAYPEEAARLFDDEQRKLVSTEEDDFYDVDEVVDENGHDVTPEFHNPQAVKE